MKSFLPTSSALAFTIAISLPASAASRPPAFVDYLNRIPTVVGSVTAADAHSVTLATDAGESMALVIDSRSVVPTTLAAGTRVRVEFHAMGADVFHARRITPLTAAEIRAEDEAGPRMRASAEPAPEASRAVARDYGNAMLGNEEGEPHPATAMVWRDRPGAPNLGPTQVSLARDLAERANLEATRGQTEPDRRIAATDDRPAAPNLVAASDQGAPVQDSHATREAALDRAGSQASPGDRTAERSSGAGEALADELPRTSSPLPLAGAVGVLALAGAGLVGLARRRPRA